MRTALSEPFPRFHGSCDLLLEVYSAVPARLLCRMLLCACSHGNFELAKACIEKGADANEGDGATCRSCLCAIANPGHSACAAASDNGADVNKSTRRRPCRLGSHVALRVRRRYAGWPLLAGQRRRPNASTVKGRRRCITDRRERRDCRATADRRRPGFPRP